jgi:hypothetical protein
MTIRLETSPGVWTEYASLRAAGIGNGCSHVAVFRHVERTGTGAGFYARGKAGNAVPFAGYPSRRSAARGMGLWGWEI